MHIERTLERLIYASRWLLAPLYLGMGVALAALTIQFFRELAVLIPEIMHIGQEDLVLLILALIDLTLVGSLLVMVMISGYEDSVSRFDLHEDTEKLTWLGKLDNSSLKGKVAMSIVAISSIHLLKVFLNVDSLPNDKIQLYVLVHLTFVASAFVMSLIDRIYRMSKMKTGHDGH